MSSSVIAQEQTVPRGSLFVCDSTDDRVLRLADVNSSGTVELEEANEIAIFYDDTSPGPDLSTPAHMAAGPDGEVLLLDGGTLDVVLRLKDQNGDGDANDTGEASVFYDSSTGGPTLYTPNTFILAPDGSFYLSDDGSAGKRILRFLDLNGDGDALDPEEALVAYDASALSVPPLEDVESLAAAPGGLLYAGDTTLKSIFVLTDLNQDADFLDEGEVKLFFQGEGDLLLNDLDAIAIQEGAIYPTDEDSGKILRLMDTNGDGDALDPGEATIFLDATASLRVSDTNDFIALPGGGFFVLDGSKDTVFFVADQNGDGDALDAGEVFQWLLDGGATFATPNGLAFVPGQNEPPPQVEFIRGEATADGRLDISDGVATLGYLFLGQHITVCLDGLDADDSGTVNISDGVYSLNFLFLGGEPPPPPFPRAGPDPTPDPIDC